MVKKTEANDKQSLSRASIHQNCRKQVARSAEHVMFENVAKQGRVEEPSFAPTFESDLRQRAVRASTMTNAPLLSPPPVRATTREGQNYKTLQMKSKIQKWALILSTSFLTGRGWKAVPQLCHRSHAPRSGGGTKPRIFEIPLCLETIS